MSLVQKGQTILNALIGKGHSMVPAYGSGGGAFGRGQLTSFTRKVSEVCLEKSESEIKTEAPSRAPEKI